MELAHYTTLGASGLLTTPAAPDVGGVAWARLTRLATYRREGTYMEVLTHLCVLARQKGPAAIRRIEAKVERRLAAAAGLRKPATDRPAEKVPSGTPPKRRPGIKTVQAAAAVAVEGLFDRKRLTREAMKAARLSFARVELDMPDSRALTSYTQLSDDEAKALIAVVNERRAAGLRSGAAAEATPCA